MSDGIESNAIESMRDAIAESFGDTRMVGTFIVIAEVTDESGETSLLTWWNGGSGWTRLGMVEWYSERVRQDIEPGHDEEDNDE